MIKDIINFQTPEWLCKEMVRMIPEGVQTVLEPTPGAGNLVKILNNYDVTAPDDFWAINSNFDAVIMNPPFSPMVEGYRILFKCMELSNIIIAVMPWLTLINSEKRTKLIKDWGLKSVTHLPRKAFAGARVQCCIIFMEKGYKGITEFRCFDKPIQKLEQIKEDVEE